MGILWDNLGVAINDTTLKIYAEEHGLGELETTQDKVSAAMQMFMEKTTYAEGNYARENETLSGSITTLKAAWTNFLSGVGGTDQLTESLLGAVNVISSKIGEILPDLMNGITELIAGIMPELPGIIQTLLPIIIQSLVMLVNTLASQLPMILQILIPIISGTIPEVINTVVVTLLENLPVLIDGALELVVAIATGIAEALPTLVPVIFDVISTIVNTLIDNAPLVLEAGVQLIIALFQGLLNELVAESVLIGDWVVENLITPTKEKISEFLEIGKQVVEKIKQGISEKWESLKSWFNNIWDSLFGNRDVNVNVNKNGGEPSASGLDYVPYNNFPAILHEGEAVLTASEADSWRKGNGSAGNGVTIIQNISAVAQTPVQLASATAAYFESARWAI